MIRIYQTTCVCLAAAVLGAALQLSGCLPDFGDPVSDRGVTGAGEGTSTQATESSKPPLAKDGPGSNNTDLFALGEQLYTKTAGGVGCAKCHGPTGEGDLGPNIRGKSKEAVITCLQTVEQMAFIHLTDREIDAVVVYLAYLKQKYQ